MIRGWIRRTGILIGIQVALWIALVIVALFLPNNPVLRAFGAPYDAVSQRLWFTPLSHGTHAWQFVVFTFVVPLCTMAVYAMLLGTVWTAASEWQRKRSSNKAFQAIGAKARLQPER